MLYKTKDNSSFCSWYPPMGGELEGDMGVGFPEYLLPICSSELGASGSQ